MTTSMISAALPAAPSNKQHSTTGGQGDTDAASPSFSSVLTSQQAPNPAPEAGTPAQVPAQADAAPNDVAHNNHAGQPQADATEKTDVEQAQLAGQQGLSLPQIALNIASEAALAMAARQPAARAVQAPARLTPNTAVLTGQELPVALDAGPAQAGAALAGNKQNALLPQAGLPGADAKLPGPANTTPLPAGFVPVLAAAAPHQTELNARKPVLAANARPALLAAQDSVRTGRASLGRPATDFSTVIANLADKAAIPTAIPADVNPAQAGSVASATASAHAALPIGGTGPGFNLAAQAASPAIATPLQSPQWASDFGRQFISLTRGGHNMPHTAELRLDPPELGPLRISINISDNVAHAIFTSPHAAVRQTVENALPQLQQLLEQAGISLGQASVNDQGQPEQSFSEASGGNRGQTATAGNTSGTAGTDTPQPGTRNRAPDALVDTFA